MDGWRKVAVGAGVEVLSCEAGSLNGEEEATRPGGAARRTLTPDEADMAKVVWGDATGFRVMWEDDRAARGSTMAVNWPVGGSDARTLKCEVLVKSSGETADFPVLPLTSLLVTPIRRPAGSLDDNRIRGQPTALRAGCLRDME